MPRRWPACSIDVFGQLPAKAQLSPVPTILPASSQKLKVIEMAVPQSVARFGLPAMPRKDKDFMPAFVLNTILGGGVMSSRLWEEVREKRGLAYSVYTSVTPYKHTSIFSGGVATRNEAVAQSLDVVRAELKRFASEGPTEKELRDAKDYLTGSFALRFDSNAKIANQLLWIQQEDLGIDYVDSRNARDRSRHAGRRQARGQASVRGPRADRHHRRQAGGPPRNAGRRRGARQAQLTFPLPVLTGRGLG